MDKVNSSRTERCGITILGQSVCYKKVVRQKIYYNEEIGEERQGKSQILRESKTEYLTKETTLKLN